MSIAQPETPIAVGLRKEAEAEVLRYAREFPGYGQARVAAELSKVGVRVSASGVRYLWQLHGLETAYKRLKALAGDDSTLSPAQRALLHRGDVQRKATRKARQQLAIQAEGVQDDRRLAILSAAARLFAERGYEGASIRELAQRVGLLPGSVYHHFRSKEELFVSVHREGFQQLIRAVTDATHNLQDPWARLHAACAAHITALVAGNSISTVTGVSLFSLHDVRLNQRLRGDRDHYEAMFADLIAALPLSPIQDRTLLRLFLFGALNWTLVWYQPGKKTPGGIATQLVHTVRYGESAATAPHP